MLRSPGLNGRQCDHKTAQGKISFVEHGEHGHVLIVLFLSWGLEVFLAMYSCLGLREMLMLCPWAFHRCQSGSCPKRLKKTALPSLDRLAQCQEQRQGGIVNCNELSTQFIPQWMHQAFQNLNEIFNNKQSPSCTYETFFFFFLQDLCLTQKVDSHSIVPEDKCHSF